MDYLRVGTDYYKMVARPELNGSVNSVLVKWKRQTIVEDHGREYLNDIPKYDGFTVFPSHTKYQQVIANFYNRYSKLSHSVAENCNEVATPYTTRFLDHVFGEQREIGLDYLTILWRSPTQILPILCLVSEERNTGKTTFLNWLKLIFQGNMTLNKNEDFRSRFNADWSEKLIIGIDEVLLDRREDSERIKNLSTARSYKTELKGKDREETNFFGKFILCSNNEQNFILIDDHEIRYWVRKVPKLTGLDPDFFDHLEKELPVFISRINSRRIVHQKRTRMWFSPRQLRTDALSNLIRGTKFHYEKELLEIVMELLDNFDLEEIALSNSEIIELFKNSNHRISRHQIAHIVIDKWKLGRHNSTYPSYHKIQDPITGTWLVEKTTKKGRHYKFEKTFVASLLAPSRE